MNDPMVNAQCRIHRRMSDDLLKVQFERTSKRRNIQFKVWIKSEVQIDAQV